MNELRRFLVVIAPESKITAVALRVRLMPYDVKIVETCVGIDICGKADAIERAVYELRSIFCNDLFFRPLEIERGEDPLFRGYLQLAVEFPSIAYFYSGENKKTYILRERSKSPKERKYPLKAIIYRKIETKGESFIFGRSSGHMPQELEEPFWICRDDQNNEVISIGGSHAEAVRKAREAGYVIFKEGGDEGWEKGKSCFLAAKLTRCSFARQNFNKEIDIALILHSDGIVVRCPLVHLCGPLWWEERCPYGKLDNNFFSTKCDETYMKKAPDLPDFFKPIASRSGGHVGLFFLHPLTNKWLSPVLRPPGNKERTEEKKRKL